jgi:predicted RNase H-like HicB family nuclease
VPAYTILVEEVPGKGYQGSMPRFPGLVIEGGSTEDCLTRAQEMVSFYLEDLAAAQALGGNGHETTTGDGEVPPRPVSDQGAAEALRRAIGALRRVEGELEADIARCLGPDRAELRRAHVALLRARGGLLQAVQGGAALPTVSAEILSFLAATGRAEWRRSPLVAGLHRVARALRPPAVDRLLTGQYVIATELAGRLAEARRFPPPEVTAS